jgi:hypothetical protein
MHRRRRRRRRRRRVLSVAAIPCAFAAHGRHFIVLMLLRVKYERYVLMRDLLQQIFNILKSTEQNAALISSNLFSQIHVHQFAGASKRKIGQ